MTVVRQTSEPSSERPSLLSEPAAAAARGTGAGKGGGPTGRCGSGRLPRARRAILEILVPTMAGRTIGNFAGDPVGRRGITGKGSAMAMVQR
jgi:hypothetical protein